MLAAINTNNLSYFSIDEWLNNPRNGRNSSLRSDRMLDGVCKDYYVVKQDNEHDLMCCLNNDLWELSSTFCNSYYICGMSFPFYIVDTVTKKVIKKLILTFEVQINVQEKLA